MLRRIPRKKQFPPRFKPTNSHSERRYWREDLLLAELKRKQIPYFVRNDNP
jgi:hypothetical protein